MEFFISICVILMTLRQPFTVTLSAADESVRRNAGSIVHVSDIASLNVNILAKPTISDQVSSISSLPPSSQLENVDEKYHTAEWQNSGYTTNQRSRNIINLPKPQSKNFAAGRNDSYRSTFPTSHVAKLVQDKHKLNTLPTLIRNLGMMVNICSKNPRRQVLTLSLSSNNSSHRPPESYRVNPNISKQHFKRPEKVKKIRLTPNFTQNSRKNNRHHQSSFSSRFSREKRELVDLNQESKVKQHEVNGDKTRIDFVQVDPGSAGSDLSLGSSTPRPTLDFDQQIPTGNYPVEKLPRDNSRFTGKYSEIPTRRIKTLLSFPHVIKPGTFQILEHENSTSLDKRYGNSSGLLNPPVAISRKWCQEQFTPYVARLYKLDCKDEEFKDGSSDAQYFVPDVETIKLTRANFQRFSEIVNQTTPARVSKLYVEDSNVADVMAVFDLFDNRFILTLNLSNNSVAELQASTFSQAAQLEYLDLSHNLIQDVDDNTFNGTTKLKYLFFRNNLLTQLRGHVFHANGRLQELHLDYNKISTIDDQALVGLTELMTLYLDHNKLGDELSRRPGIFAPCSNLQTLLLSHCQITTLSKQVLLGLAHLQNLDLSWNLLTQIAPGTFFELRVLSYLNLENNQLKLVSPTWNLPPTLKILSLAGNEITDIKDGVFDAMDLSVVFLNSNKLQTLSPTLQMYLSARNNVTLANNSWQCDCNLVYLIHLVNSRLHSLYDDVTCASPRRMRMLAISMPDIKCPIDKSCTEAVCTPCTRGLQRKVDSRCVCMEGTQPSGGLMSRTGCSACPADHYKPAAGNAACAPCSSGSIPVSGPSPVCACAVGYYTNKRGDCEKCQPGTYKTYAGVGSCSACTVASTHIPQCSLVQQVLRQNSTSTRTVEDPDIVWPSVTAAVGVLVLIAVIIIIILVRYYHSKQKLATRYTMKTSLRSPSQLIMDADTQNSHGSNSNSVEFRCNGRDCIRVKSIGNMIGRGAFGQVFEGYVYLTSHDKEPVKIAVKRLKDSATDEEVKSMKEELDQMFNVGPHPNIIGLYGSVFYDGQLCIVMEYAELGDLLTYLRTECASPLQYVLVGSNGLVVEQSAPQVEDNAILMMFAWQIAKGMSHLEIHRFIHRDLAARNCLLTKGPIAKVSDFGLSKDAYELGHYKRVQKDRVPFKWLSPEALLWGQYSSKSDVWAFGILLYELYTFGGTPYPQVTTEQLRELHENGYRMSKPPACPEKLYRIMRACWREDPRQRPSFKQLVHTLDDLLQTTNDREYLELHPHGLKSSNPFPFTREDMDDQKTSVEFVYRYKKLYSYQSRHTYCEPPYDNMTIAINLLNKHDNILYSDTSHLPVGITDISADTTSNGSSTTSGFQSMSSAQTM